MDDQEWQVQGNRNRGRGQHNRSGRDGQSGFGHGGSNQGGFSRGGFNQGGFGRNGSNQGEFGRGGSNQDGFKRGGSNQGGFSRGGSNQGGFSRGGSNQGGFSRGGSNQGGFGRSGSNQGGFRRDGSNQGGFRRDGSNQGGSGRGGIERGESRQGRDPRSAGPSALEIISQLPYEEHSVRLRQKLPLPARKRGEEVSLIANCFKLELDPQLPIYQYTLAIRGERVSPRFFSNAIIKEFFDGEQLNYFHDTVRARRTETPESRNEQLHRIYAIGQSIQPRPAQEVSIGNRDFQVELMPNEKVISLEEVERFYRQERSDIPTEIITTLNIGFGSLLGDRFQFFQKAYYEYDRVLDSLPFDLVDIVAGFKTSIIKSEFGLALNLHPATAAVIPKRYDTMADMYLDCRNDRKKLANFHKLIGKIRIKTVHSKRMHRVDGLARNTPSTESFSKNGQIITIKDYFADTYNIQVNPDLPLVRMKEMNRQNDSNIYLPMDMCGFSPEERFISQNFLSPFVRDKLKRENTKKPEEYFNLMFEFIKIISEFNRSQKVMDNVDVKKAFSKVSGEVLNPPRIVPSRNDRFYCNASKTKWAIVSLVNQWNSRKFVDDLIDEARKHQMELAPPALIRSIEANEAVVDSLFQEFQTKGIKFVVFGTSNDEDALSEESFDCTLYHKIKYYSEIKYGIMCQCASTEKTGKRGYASNILLKINAKMGGVNQAIDMSYLRDLPFDSSKTMVLGLDVNHSSSGEHAVSVAAAVGSLDSQFHRYTSTCRVQPREDYECLGQLDSMLGELLDCYRECNKKYPENLIIFRDGVSEGQMMGQGKKWSVMATEVPLIRKALAERKLTNVKITLLVVQKRHSIRLALMNMPRNPRDRSNFNATAGTVVCQMVVDPAYKTFILYSHKCPMGTSKPQIYTVLMDELKLSHDFYTITDFCMAMCGICFRTEKTISIPTPIRYADLYAFKAKGHLLAHQHFNGGSLEEIDHNAIRVHPNLKYSPHFI